MPHPSDTELDFSTDTEEAQEPLPDPDDHFDVLFDEDDSEVDDGEPGPVAELAGSTPTGFTPTSPDATGPVPISPVPSGPVPTDSTWAGLSTVGFAPVPAVGTSPSTDFPGRRAFRLGRSHPAVTLLGTLLIGRGGRRFYREGAGPRFGTADRNACAAFQRAQGWKGDSADGYPGPLTWKLLVEREGKDIPKNDPTPRSPVPGYRPSYAFGVRNRRYAAGFHTGCDYAAPNGTPIVAVVAGTVIRADHGGAYGSWTQIRGEDGHVWMYAHQSRRVVRRGQRVRAGQVIGYVGSTGQSTGAHLHLEKSTANPWAYGRVVNPTW